MKIGASPWKLGILGLALLGAGYGIYSNLTSDDRPPSARAATPRTAPRGAPADLVPGPPAAETRSRPPLASESRQLRLTLKDKHADPTTTDPSLRLDLLAKVQNVNLAGGERNLFQFGAAPLPPVPERKIPVQPLPPPVTSGTPSDPPAAPVAPPPPPIPLKFYGYSTNPQPSVKRAFFLQADEIVVAREGELIKKRYKVVRVAVDSCVVEDMETKNQQTLRMEEQQP